MDLGLMPSSPTDPTPTFVSSMVNHQKKARKIKEANPESRREPSDGSQDSRSKPLERAVQVCRGVKKPVNNSSSLFQ